MFLGEGCWHCPFGVTFERKFFNIASKNFGNPCSISFSNTVVAKNFVMSAYVDILKFSGLKIKEFFNLNLNWVMAEGILISLCIDYRG